MHTPDRRAFSRRLIPSFVKVKGREEIGFGLDACVRLGEEVGGWAERWRAEGGIRV